MTHGFNGQQTAVLASGVPRVRPVYFKELGEFLAHARERLGWSQSEAADFARRRALKSVTRQVILRLERGQTKNPPPEVLRELADLYDISYQDLVAKWVAYRFGVNDLIGHAMPADSAASKGGTADVPASDRDRAEVDRVPRADYDEVLTETRKIANRLLDFIGEHELRAQGRPAPGRKARVRRGTGKTG